MKGLGTIFAAVLPAVVLVGLLIVFLRRCCFRKGGNFVEPAARTEGLQEGINSLHLAYKNSSLKEDVHDVREKKRPNYYVLRNGVLAKPLFSWADHPWLISEAVEHGWTRFAFCGYSSSSSLPRSTTTAIWDLCSVCDYRREGGAEFSWEVTSGASEYMQKIRLSPGSKSENPSGVCYAKAALPLPGPPLGNASFPQEAYFEIIILGDGEDGVSGEGEKIKLISDASIKSQSDSLFHVNSSKSEKSNSSKKVDGVVKDRAGLVSLGLTSSTSPPSKFPGSYQGSIGFNSNGSVLLDGMKLVSESKLCDWGVGERVIGCGFDPTQKKVIFTVDSQLIHQIYCKTEDFGTPLYPILAATANVTVFVNLGQSSFKYRPANLRRTPNPCFLRPLSDTSCPGLGYEEDSRELFSMGRIDSHWSASRKNGYDETMTVESEDLFEIVLDDRGPPR
ncbi:hypothetical protein H6P81_020570 [Aristolochia fimbriata]|uniref:B30.2/SPRY domain-containing protein n=1 Tax=Aristolochia fimbriata TaxID=158543 RepID=A0AAV7DUR5_ARIFI|nr:hypothetical protein H6P81_020570 [Aristolochia fimbriata]